MNSFTFAGQVASFPCDVAPLTLGTAPATAPIGPAQGAGAAPAAPVDVRLTAPAFRQRNLKKYELNMTRIAATHGDALGSHPAWDPV